MRNKIRPMQLAPVGSGAAARIRLALLLTTTVLVVEVVGGLFAHSLALLSDAGHVVTDLVVLALSAFALRQVQRPATARRTFGYQRVGILVALVNALLLGAMLGRLVAVGLMVGMFAALVPGVYLLARHGQAARKMAIPFAPFLALGSIVALFAGKWVLDAYLSLLGA